MVSVYHALVGSRLANGICLWAFYQQFIIHNNIMVIWSTLSILLMAIIRTSIIFTNNYWLPQILSIPISDARKPLFPCMNKPHTILMQIRGPYMHTKCTSVDCTSHLQLLWLHSNCLIAARRDTLVSCRLYCAVLLNFELCKWQK